MYSLSLSVLFSSSSTLYRQFSSFALSGSSENFFYWCILIHYFNITPAGSAIDFYVQRSTKFCVSQNQFGKQFLFVSSQFVNFKPARKRREKIRLWMTLCYGRNASLAQFNIHVLKHWFCNYFCAGDLPPVHGIPSHGSELPHLPKPISK
jgi:hypothetical protein